MNLFFKVSEVEGDKAKTKLVSMELLFSFVRTMVRRYKSVSTSVVTTKSKDGREVTVKPIIITMQRSASSKIRGIRSEMNAFLEKYVQANDADSIIKAVIEGALQQELYAKLKHVSPISKVEIKKLEINQ
jgi:ribosomal protein S3AE